MTQHRYLQAIQLPPVVPTVHIQYLDLHLTTVQAFNLLQHELAEVAALAAVQAQLDQAYGRKSRATGAASAACSDLAIISVVRTGTSPTAVTR